MKFSTLDDRSPFSLDQPTPVLRTIFDQLGLVLKLERHLFGIIASYALAIGMFMLCVPIAVQELVSTFSFAVEPIMILTLTMMVAAALTGAAAFRVLQARAVETLQQRLYTRIAIAFTQTLPRVENDHDLARHANRFIEADLLTRAVVAMLADLFNVAVVGSIFMTMLVTFHPYFVLYNAILISGFLFLLVVFGQGGFGITLEMSSRNYAILGWIQNIALNVPHLRAFGETPFLLQKTDTLTQPYVRVRQQRSDTLTGRQYKATALWQMVGHSGMIATAGMLVSVGQLTIGQFAAAELLAANLLFNMDTLARRMVHMFFAFVSFHELFSVLALPKVEDRHNAIIPAEMFGPGGLKVTTRNLSFAVTGEPPLFHNLDLDVASGEKVAILCQNNIQKATLANVLAGLTPPTTGVVRYNEMNLVEIGLASISGCRSLLLDSQPFLLDGTLEENITLGRPSVTYQDIMWALSFTELDEEVDAMSNGLKTVVSDAGQAFTLSQILRILLARAIAAHPRLLICAGTLHSMLPTTREVILRRLCSKDEPWSVIFTSNDATFSKYVDRQISLH